MSDTDPEKAEYQFVAMACDINLFGKETVDPSSNRFPHCIVWTPIPCLTWLFPFIGHMGICTTSGIIRDFSGSYIVSEDNMAFGDPVKYWQLDLSYVGHGKDSWDHAVAQASEEYNHRMHDLFCSNCHSHVAMSLNLMNFGGCSNWSMIMVCSLMLVHGKYISVSSFLKTWLPFIMMVVIIVTIVTVTGTTSKE